VLFACQLANFKEKKNDNQRQLQVQPQLQGGVKIAESVPFLYKQNKRATMMGSPQPLNTFEQKIPSFEPRTSKAMRIQRVTLLP
jgi:hypothetical protein